MSDNWIKTLFIKNPKKEPKLVTKTIKESIFPNGLRLVAGITDKGQWQLDCYQDGIYQISKKCSCEADAIQRFGKYETKYFLGININL